MRYNRGGDAAIQPLLAAKLLPAVCALPSDRSALHLHFTLVTQACSCAFITSTSLFDSSAKIKPMQDADTLVQLL